MADVRNKKKCLAICIRKGDPILISKAYETLGSAYEGLQEYDKAIEYLKKGLERATDIGFWVGLITIRKYLSTC